MSTIVHRRPPRRPAPAFPHGEFPLQEPPGLPEEQGGQISTLLMYLPMAAASAVMMLMFVVPGAGGAGRVIGYLGAGLMAVAMVAMAVAQLARTAGDRKLRLKGERRDYLRYLGQVRKKVRSAIDSQRESMLWIHPDPKRLWAVAGSDRLWERRAAHADFCEVRIGLGPQQLALRLQAPQTKPVEDLEPLCASALRRFLRAYATVDDLPMAIYLRSFGRILFTGDTAAARGLTRALVGQLATFHSPDDLKIVVCAGQERMPDWDWVKWLPHTLHPAEHDAAGQVRMVAETWGELESLLGEEFTERGRFDPKAAPSSQEPYVVVVLDGVPQPQRSRPATAGYRNTTILDVDGSLPFKDDRTTLRLALTGDAIEMVEVNRAGTEVRRRIGGSDALSTARCRTLARQLAPFRAGRASETVDPTVSDIDLTRLLGVRDARSLPIGTLWQPRSPWDHLRVPIGITETGQPVELDIKESAQGGMGPHGILIGATGSGKSELLRTLVLSMALTHSSEVLNMVLVDFKGGATFAGLEHLPHVSAFITNLSEALELVDRMQDSLHGELVRRQELLRATGYSSMHDYERARAAGADLEPLPTLFVIVDEFGELLASKGEFMDLFVMIGRLGRSLGVHLLLASQRLEEGRIHALETHLSYRIGLRMFGSAESRSVLGVTDAYDKPLAPGQGYLRTDTTTLIKFKGAYVSGPIKAVAERAPATVVQGQVVRYSAGYLAPLTPRTPAPEQEPEVTSAGKADVNAETLLTTAVEQLRDGPEARRIWLPPLDVPPTLDGLLGLPVIDQDRGLVAGHDIGNLRVPVGVIDRPFEQRRDLLLADLGGAAGHVGIVGGTQAGKSTALRTLISAIALTHTPAEVQFYVLDFGGGSMATLAGLPHVGSVANRLDKERANRTVSEVIGIIDAREQRFNALGIDSMATYRKLRREGEVTDDPYGDVFLVVDGWMPLRQEFDHLEQRIQEVMSRALSYGLHLVVTSNRWSEIRPWLRDLLGTRFELRLGDSIESEVDFRKAKEVPAIPGRGLTADKHHFLTALPRIDGNGDATDASAANRDFANASAQAWRGAKAPDVRLLPADLPASDLPAIPRDGLDLRLPLGVDDIALEPVWHDFGQSPDLIVIGDAETGKTNLLRLIARGITERFSPAQARIMFADPRRQLYSAVPVEYHLGYPVSQSTLAASAQEACQSLHARLPGPEITPDRLSLRDWWKGPQLFVIVDDYELLTSGIGSPLEPFTELIGQGAETGVHLVIARASSGAGRSMSDPVIRRLWENTTPALLLSARKEEGFILGDVRGTPLPVGRAQYIDRRRTVRLVQTGRLRDSEEKS